MTAQVILMFVSGAAIGFCAAFVFLAVLKSRRINARDANQARAFKQLADWRRNNPDIVATWNNANIEPTELDQ